jgi:subtilase family serine protease
MLPIENKLLTITVNIYNNGKLPALATQLAVYEGDPFGVIEYVRIAEVNCSISGYSNVTLTMNWTPTRGEHNLWFIIDPYQTVPELNKANNRVTIVLFVAEIPSKPPAQEIDWLNIYLIVIYGAIAGSIIFVCVYIMLRTIYRIRRRTRR